MIESFSSGLSSDVQVIKVSSEDDGNLLSDLERFFDFDNFSTDGESEQPKKRANLNVLERENANEGDSVLFLYSLSMKFFVNEA